MTLSLSLHQTRNAQSRADFWNKLSIACKEAREKPYWLRLLAAADIVGDPRLAEILDEADQLIAILTTITRKIRQNSEVWISKLERASNE
jgi:four helix bundle protein